MKYIVFRKTFAGHFRIFWKMYFISVNFCGYKLSRSWEIAAKFSDFHANFDHFPVFLIIISRIKSTVSRV